MSVVTIDAPAHPTRFNAAVIVENGRIVTAAPILGWTVGKTLTEVKTWAIRKGYRVVEEW